MRGEDEIRDPAARFDALWEATRPVEPSAQAWDRVWASVADDLDRLSAPTAPARREGVIVHRPSPAFSRRPPAAAAVAVVLAQAAAILLAFGLSWSEDRTAETPGQSQVATAKVRIEGGQLVLIRSNADAVQAIDLSAQLGAGGVDSWYVFYNGMESVMTNPALVSR